MERADIHDGPEQGLQSEAGYIYGQPRLRKGQLMWTGRLQSSIQSRSTLMVSAERLLNALLVERCIRRVRSFLGAQIDLPSPVLASQLVRGACALHYAALARRSSHSRSCFINAHATRTLLLAKATVATFIGRRPRSPPIGARRSG
jgi:hypothetical protein